MKLMFPEKIRVAAFIAIAAVLVFFAGDAAAQKRKTPPKKAVQSKKAQSNARDARKDPKNNKSRDKGHTADSRSKKDPKKLAEARRADAERRRKEEEHRQAVIAEERRRAEAARQARERKLAFERGLRTETVANIARDATEYEDPAIRRAAIEALGTHAGSVVVMEAKTGRVLSIVNQDWAVRSTIKPCSTIKLVTGVAGLNEGVISKEDGSIRNTSTRRNLDDAIAFSDNSYFQRVGANVGSPKLIDYAKKLGLGEPTGINMDGEAPGKLPYGNNNARIYSHGDDFEVSGVQLAVLVSEITNGGHRVLPRIPRNTIERTSMQTFYKADLGLPQQNVRRMIPGMMGAAEYGTAHRGVDASLGIAGKTGSCISKGSWVGLFASVAPIEDPKYSVVVITRGQGERGKYAAAVAGKVYQALSRNIVRTDRNLAQTEFKVAPKSTADKKAAVKAADDADDDDDTADTDAAPSTDNGQKDKVILVPVAPRQNAVDKPSPKKLVQRTGSSAPVFAPVIITYSKDPNDKTADDPTHKKRQRIVHPDQ